MAISYKKRIIVNGDDLRDCNGIRVRELQIPGTTYYIPVFYTVTVNTNNGSGDSESWLVPEGTTINISGTTISYIDVFGDSDSISAGSKTNYSWDGWSVSTSFVVNANVTIEGSWTYVPPIPSYVTLTVVTNNTSYPGGSFSVPYGSLITVSNADRTVSWTGDSVYAGTRTNYSWDGWDKQSFYIYENTTVSASWTYIPLPTYTVTVKQYNGGPTLTTWYNVPEGTTISISGQTVYYGSSSISAGTRSGYTWQSWNTSTFSVYQNTTIYGIWEEVPSYYSVDVYFNSDRIDSVSVYYNDYLSGEWVTSQISTSDKTTYYAGRIEGISAGTQYQWTASMKSGYYYMPTTGLSSATTLRVYDYSILDPSVTSSDFGVAEVVNGNGFSVELYVDGGLRTAVSGNSFVTVTGLESGYHSFRFSGNGYLSETVVEYIE